MAKSNKDKTEKPAKKKKKEEYKDDGITKLEVWDSDMHVYHYTIDINGHFIDKGN